MVSLAVEGVSIGHSHSAGRQRDPCPAVRAAGGYARAGPAEDSAKCVLQPELYNSSRCPSPEHEKRSGNTRRDANGRQRFLREDSAADAEKPMHWSGHGKPSVRSESVGALMQAHRDRDGINGSLLERKEAFYDSNLREPLGKSHVRGHKLPERVSEPGFCFGNPTGAPKNHSDQSGKDVILPTHSPLEDTAVHQQYVRSHYAFSPGEQIQRRYAWPSEVVEDPSFRFGGASKSSRAKDSVGSALFGGGAWGVDPSVQTKIVEKSGEDYRQMDHDHVGKGRSGFAGRPPVPPGFSFGIGSRSGSTAGEAIRGSYTPQEQLPDDDLGKCMKPGRRNLTPNPEHTFGKPSGLQRPNQRAASASAPSARPAFQPPPRTGASCDWENVGPTAPRMQRYHHSGGGVAMAIAPGCYDDKVHEDFAKGRSRGEVKSLLKDVGCNMAPAEFGELWNIAAKPSFNGEIASIDSFAKAYAERQATTSVPNRIAPARVNTHARIMGA